MKVWFEELREAQRAGGIETATTALVSSMHDRGVHVVRSAQVRSSNAVSPADCVHLHGIWSPKLVASLRRFLKQQKPCIVSPHGMLQPWALGHKAFKKKVAWAVYQKRSLNQASALHATSQSEAEQFRKLGLRPPIAVIPWGVELPSSRKSVVTERSRASRTALFIGRIYPVKGLPMLVEAWAKVRPSGWRMRIVGPDEAGHQAEVESRIQNAGLSQEFEFTGELQGEAKEEAFANSDLFILPTHSENFGMAIGEALSRGLPVITTQGAPWEFLEREGCGWWTPISVDGIAAALSKATTMTPDALKQMGDRGRKIVKERFAWPTIAGQFEQTYQWLIGQGRKPQWVLS